MKASESTKVKWRWSILPAVAILFLSLLPQTHFWLIRGSQWHGAYAILQGDETYYSAYINALIDGRPRRTDPFTGQDDHPEARMFESLFSIQFLPPYAIALVARAFGLSASTAFILLAAVAGALTSIAIFWVFVCVTKDEKFAAAAVLFVVCLGAVAAGQGWIGLIFSKSAMFAGQLYLRRYLPSAPFPVFFAFCALVYQTLTSPGTRSAVMRAFLAGVTLAVLIFSYFYLWTAAVAWFVCLGGLWLIFRAGDRRATALRLTITTIPILAALAFYTYLLSHLSPAVHKAQVLTFTHRPDLLRVPEILGALILLALILAVSYGKVSKYDPPLLFAASCALLPFLVFNQQVVTGQSIQPYHYEAFIVNYVVLMALVILIKLLKPHLSRRALVTAASLCFLWGVIEVNQQFKIRSTFDVSNDEMVPVLLRLKELAPSDGTWERLRSHGKTRAVVYSPTYGLERLLPTWAPQGTLLASGSAAYQSLSAQQRKEWLYMHLYYSGKKAADLVEILNNRTDDVPFSFFAKSTIFGNERTLLFLGQDSRPVQLNEIEQEGRAYADYVKAFSAAEVEERLLSYAVILRETHFDFSRLDHWYERDDGEAVGAYILYRLKRRPTDVAQTGHP